MLAEFPGWAAQVGSPSLSHVPGTPSGDAQQELTLPLLSLLAPTGGRESGKRTRRCHPNTCRSLGTDATTSPGTALLGEDGMCSPPRQNEVMAGGDRDAAHPERFSLRDAPSFLFTGGSGKGTINNSSPIGWRGAEPPAGLILTGQVSGQKASKAAREQPAAQSED